MITGFHTIVCSDEGFGPTAMITVPGAGQMMLYEARHELAHRLRD